MEVECIVIRKPKTEIGGIKCQTSYFKIVTGSYTSVPAPFRHIRERTIAILTRFVEPLGHLAPLLVHHPSIVIVFILLIPQHSAFFDFVDQTFHEIIHVIESARAKRCENTYSLSTSDGVILKRTRREAGGRNVRRFQSPFRSFAPLTRFRSLLIKNVRFSRDALFVSLLSRLECG